MFHFFPIEGVSQLWEAWREIQTSSNSSSSSSAGDGERLYDIVEILKLLTKSGHTEQGCELPAWPYPTGGTFSCDGQPSLRPGEQRGKIEKVDLNWRQYFRPLEMISWFSPRHRGSGRSMWRLSSISQYKYLIKARRLIRVSLASPYEYWLILLMNLYTLDFSNKTGYVKLEFVKSNFVFLSHSLSFLIFPKLSSFVIGIFFPKTGSGVCPQESFYFI